MANPYQVAAYGLPPPWAKYLADRAVTPKAAAARGYRVLKQGSAKGGIEFSGAWGYPTKASGLLIPLHSIFSADGAGAEKHQLRLDDPSLFPDKDDKPRKFLSPKGQKTVLATSPLTRDRLKEPGEIWIVEGVTRVDAVAGYEIAAAGILGAWNWKAGVILPDFDTIHIKDSDVIIALDGDIQENRGVRTAGERLQELLSRRGANVAVLVLPDGMGLDDWIANGHYETAADLKSSLVPYLHKGKLPPPRGRREQTGLDPQEYGIWARSPWGDAARLLYRHAERLLVVFDPEDQMRATLRILDEETGIWRDDRPRIEQLLIETARAWDYSGFTSDEAQRVRTHAVKSATPEGRTRALASVGPAYRDLEQVGNLPKGLTTCVLTDLDSSRRYMGTPGGVLDVHEGTVMTASEGRRRLITKQIPDLYDPNAKHAHVDKMLSWLGEKARKWIVSALGHALRGYCNERIYVLMGSGDNGKSTFMQAVIQSLGEYGSEMQSNALRLGTGGQPDAPTPSKFAVTGGKRLAILDEPDSRMDWSLVKGISGSTRGSARLLHKNPKDVEYTGTMVWSMNEFPRIPDESGGDRGAVYRRIRVLPMGIIPEEERDPSLKTLFTTDARARQALFAELVRGSIDNPEPPADIPTVAEARREMREESLGEFGLWLQHVLAKDPSEEVKVPVLWDTALAVFGTNGEIRGWTKTRMTQALRRHYGLPPTTPISGQRGWRGWRKRSDEEIARLMAQEKCSQCPHSWLRKYLCDLDGRGKVCIGCRGVVVVMDAGLCQVCEEDKEPLFEIEDTTGGSRVCLDCINKDNDDIDSGLKDMLDDALARYIAEQQGLLPLQAAATAEQAALEAKMEQLQLVVRAADASNPTADERQAGQQIRELTRIWASMHYLRAANPDIIFPYESDKAREHIRGFVDAMLADPTQHWDRVNWKKTLYNARVEYEAKLQPAQPAHESLQQSLVVEMYPTGGVAAVCVSERPQQAALDKQLRYVDDDLEFIHREISLLEGFKLGQEQLAWQIDALTRIRAALVALRDSNPDTVNPVADVEAALRVSSIVGYMRSYPAYPWDSWSVHDWAKILNDAKQRTKDAEDMANLEPLRLETAKQGLLAVLREWVKPMLVPTEAKEQTP